MAEPITLAHWLAPGDVTAMSGCVRDLALSYPNEYEIHIATSCKTLWENNPHIAAVHQNPPKGIPMHKLDYGGHIRSADRCTDHFLTAFHKDLSKKLQRPVPVLYSKGALYLDDWHKQNRPVDGRYWFIVTGGKSDFTAKIWSAARWQQTVQTLRSMGVRFVQGGALHKGHYQPPMAGALDLIDQLNLREILWLIYHADGVICHVTAMMHMAAALDRPCVVIAGGREHWWWEAYVNVKEQIFGPDAAPIKVPHRYLHTQGLLDCCKTRGCWKNKVTAQERDKNRSYCKKPMDDGFGQLTPACLHMITVNHVVEAVMSYYEDETLPPIGKPPRIDLLHDPRVIPEELRKAAHLKTQVGRNKTATPAKFVPVSVTTTPQGIVKPLPFIDFRAFRSGQTTQAQPAPHTELQLQHEVKGDHAGKSPLAAKFDNPIIGNKVTICVLMYGDYAEMHRRCVNSIITTTPPDYREIRIVCNDVCAETRVFLEMLQVNGVIRKLIFNDDNRKKYPAMRQLFHDQDDPITTNWVIWFDDDSIANRDPKWLAKLLDTIIAYHESGHRLFGAEFSWKYHPAQVAWIKTRPWYRKRPFQIRCNQGAPNGNKGFFAAGGFWALSLDMIRQQNIPDPEIGHNGGDFMIGEQAWQGGSKLKGWNNKKQFIHTSSVGRRGLREHETGMPEWVPGGTPK